MSAFQKVADSHVVVKSTSRVEDRSHEVTFSRSQVTFLLLLSYNFVFFTVNGFWFV